MPIEAVLGRPFAAGSVVLGFWGGEAMDLTRPRPVAVALLLAALGAVTLLTVWTLDGMGYTPCELCMTERQPFYVAVPLALATAGLAATGRRRLPLAGYCALACLFLAGLGLGIYHAGVEWQVWPGPSGCSGAITAPAGVNDFLKQLNSVKVVRCDAAALRVLGLSLAGWNAILCAILAGVAVVGARAVQAGSSLTASAGRTMPPSTTLA